ncbi:hypothetical protein RSAG8_05839, partial [Rhizoctonia solani AG-8 WAC10335]
MTMNSSQPGPRSLNLQPSRWNKTGDPATCLLTHPTMFIAGLNLPFTEPQALNGLACASITASLWFAWPRSDFRKRVEEKAGKAVHMPTGKRGELITAAHSLALFAPTALFLITVPLNKFIQPDWLAQYALPKVSLPTYYAARIGASASIWLSGTVVKTSIKHLDAQFNYIGVRERPELVNTGPFRVVRHPMYRYGPSEYSPSRCQWRKTSYLITTISGPNTPYTRGRFRIGLFLISGRRSEDSIILNATT